MCKKVRDLVYSDRRIQVEEIAQALGTSHGSVSTILHDRLGMCKLTALWVPKSLSNEQMATRASVCSALLKHFRSKDDFLLRLVTVDEIWVHYYEPENKAQSRQWVGPGSPRPKKFKTQPSAGKVMATVFWDAKGIIMLDFLGQKKIIIRFSGPAACTKKSAHKPFFPCPIKKTHPHLDTACRCVAVFKILVLDATVAYTVM